jgi:hypothetical protein
MEIQLQAVTLALDASHWSVSCPGHFTPMERAHSTHWIGEWVDSITSMDAMNKDKYFSSAKN